MSNERRKQENEAQQTKHTFFDSGLFDIGTNNFASTGTYLMKLRTGTNAELWGNELRQFSVQDIDNYVMGLNELMQNEAENANLSIDDMKRIAEEMETWKDLLDIIKRLKPLS